MTDEQKPVAWIDDSGHPRHVGHVQTATERRLYGPLRPLFEQAAIDAAVAAERERWEALCEWLRIYTWVQEDGSIDYSKPRARPEDLQVHPAELADPIRQAGEKT